ncbi:MAG TPA: MlaD family protein [Conexibacter sp.]|jgi:phospholipid/cholesterol/gamma-HCH transport system substrate-binding protein|nr:MlaD family protein [Conexibacter sp.]
MTIARGAVLGALLAVVAVLAIVVLSNGGGTQYRLIFQNAGQLVKGDDVQIGGRRVGGVDDILLTPDNQAEIVVTVQDPYAPLHAGTTATIRLTSLSGVANRYIALSPGPNNAPEIPGGGRLGVEQTTSVVDLDQIFNTLDPRTRTGLQQFIQGSATQYEGQGANVNQSAKYFNPFLSTTDQLVKEVALDQTTLERAIVAGASVTGAVAQRAPQLTSLVTNLNTMMGAIAAENGSLSQALGVLPDTLRQGDSTFVDLRSTLDDLDPLLRASSVAARDLPRFFSQLRPLLNEGTPVFADFSRLVSQPGPFNDATDAVQNLPRLQQIGSPAFKSAVTALREGQPVIDFLRPYSPDLVGWFRDFGQSAANYDANGHYARAMPIFGAFNFQQNGDGSSTLQPVGPSQRLSGLTSGFTRRCPGAASQPRPDGSNPFAPSGFDCNRQDVPPGP